MLFIYLGAAAMDAGRRRRGGQQTSFLSVSSVISFLTQTALSSRSF